MARSILRKWIAVALLSLIVPGVTGQQAEPVQNTVEVGETKALHDLSKATTVVKDLKALADALGKFDISPGKIASVVTKLAGLSPYLGALGAVLGLVELFSPKETSPVMKELNAISGQISAFQDQADAWFKVIKKMMISDTCKILLSDSVQTIVSSHEQLLTYQQTRTDLTKQMFMQACSGGGACETATNTLLNSLNGIAGPSGCNVMEVAYQGMPDGNLLQGSLISMQLFVGGLVMKAAHSISVLAAFEAMKLGDKENMREKAEAVASLYQDRFQQVATRWTGFLKKAYSSVPQNVQVSANQWAAQHSTESASYLTNGMAGLLRHNYGSHLVAVFTASAKSFFSDFCHLNTSPEENYNCLQVKVEKKADKKVDKNLLMTVVLLPFHQTPQAAQAVQWLKQHCGNPGGSECLATDPKTFYSPYEASAMLFSAQVDLSHDDHGPISDPVFEYNVTGNVSKYAFFTTWQWRQRHGFLGLRHWTIRSWYITVR